MDKKNILLVENDSFYADMLQLWLVHLPGVGRVIRVRDWGPWGDVEDRLDTMLMRGEQVPESGMLPDGWVKCQTLNRIVVVGPGAEFRAPAGCFVTVLPAGADSCDVICALGLKDEVRRHVRGREPRNLTPKEQIVVDMSVKGCSFKEIAEELDCTLSTVQSHKQRAMEKLGVTNLTDLTVCAAARGWRSCPCRTFTQDSLFITS